MTTTIEHHFEIVGTFLQELPTYREPRDNAARDMVYRAICACNTECFTTSDLTAVLRAGDVPILTRGKIKETVKALRAAGDLDIIPNKSGCFRLTATPKVIPESEFLARLGSVHSRFFGSCKDVGRTQFLEILARVCAQYGCAVVSAFDHGAPAAPYESIDQMLKAVVKPSSADDEQHASSCLRAFLYSSDPDVSALKFQLASIYAALRMNGAGNWKKDDVRNLISGKTLILDTNILFELAGPSSAQVRKLLFEMHAIGAKFAVATETKKEFETAVRTHMDSVLTAVANGTDFQSLVDARVVRAGWIATTLAKVPTKKASVDDYFEAISKDVDAALTEFEATSVHIELTEDTEERRTLVEKIQTAAEKTRPFGKGDNVARHDALLWETVCDGEVADLLLTVDRSFVWLNKEESRERLVYTLDDLLAYCLLGMLRGDDFTSLVAHAIATDLMPSSEFLSIDDIKTLSRLDNNLAGAPVETLRATARKLSKLKVDRAQSGDRTSESEIQRIFFDVISTADQGRRELAREREQRLAIEEQLKNITEKVAALSLDKSESDRLSGQVSELGKQISALQAQLTAAQVSSKTSEELATNAKKERDEFKQDKEVRREWALAASLGFVVVPILWFVLGMTTAAGVVFAGCAVAVLWSQVITKVPRFSAKAITGFCAVLAAVAVVGENWAKLAKLVIGP